MEYGCQKVDCEFIECDGTCEEYILQCDECGETAEFDQGVDYPEEETECCGVQMKGECGGDIDEQAWERQQMGIGG